jgi:hypothetical protein
MEVLLRKLNPGSKLCLVRVTEQEAVNLIKSLASQLLSGDLNHPDRLESFCSGDVTEMTITVHSKGGV